MPFTDPSLVAALEPLIDVRRRPDLGVNAVAAWHG